MFRRSSKAKKQEMTPILSSTINTMVGFGSTVRGDFQVKGFLRIDGDLIGKVKCTERVVLGSGARMKGNIVAEEIVVAGALMGDLVAHSKVKILSSAVVIGNITASRLIIEQDAIVDGVCSVKESRDHEASSALFVREQEYFSPWEKTRKGIEFSSGDYTSK